MYLITFILSYIMCGFDIHRYVININIIYIYTCSCPYIRGDLIYRYNLNWWMLPGRFVVFLGYPLQHPLFEGLFDPLPQHTALISITVAVSTSNSTIVHL